MHRSTPPVADRRQAGLSLIELLIILSVIGLLTTIGWTSISAAFQRQRVSSTAQEIATFLNGAFSQMVGTGSGVVVTLSKGADGRFTLNLSGTSTVGQQRVYQVPDKIRLSSVAAEVESNWPRDGDNYVLGCSPTGRVYDPTAGLAVITTVRTLTLTHADMYAGHLEPRLRYVIEIFPLWRAKVRTERY